MAKTINLTFFVLYSDQIWVFEQLNAHRLLSKCKVKNRLNTIIRNKIVMNKINARLATAPVFKLEFCIFSGK